MSAFRRISLLAFVCLASFCAGQVFDPADVTRVLGPHWRHMSRASGTVFTGTVISVAAEPTGKQNPLPIAVIRFRVNEAIVGVQPGQTIAIREWAGAWSMHRAMSPGERLLIFLYPPSRMGLTSPVGGRQGQVVLNARGDLIMSSLPEFEASEKENPPIAVLKRCSARNQERADCAPISHFHRITLQQLARAIRNAHGK
ncbi:MAG: hypothetical protein HY010_03885 [Acidobacteria bacterium]|nr:hypothetical protein [Acidobacteriota bacterium]